MFKKPPFTAVLASTVFLLVGTALAQESQSTKSSSDRSSTTSGSDHMKSGSGHMKGGSDHQFVMKAAQGGMAEVEFGRLAEKNASSEDVKQFGKRMVDDHSKANDELKQVAARKGMTIPDDMGAKHKAKMDQLSKLSGEQFDKAYMTDMVKDHKEDVAEFQREANQGRDQDVKAFAANTLPTLQEHLRMAQDTASKVKGMGGSKSHRESGSREQK